MGEKEGERVSVGGERRGKGQLGWRKVVSYSS